MDHPDTADILSVLDRAVDDWRDGDRDFVESPDVGEEPTYIHGNQRSLSRCAPPDQAAVPRLNLDLLRLTMQQEMRDYLRTPDPGYALLLTPPPGAGKTWAGVEFAHWAQTQDPHSRIFYAGPRHDFFPDILRTVDQQGQDPNIWLEWKPRQNDDQDERRHTCHWAVEIGQWMEKGYESWEFCQRVCGRDFMANGCKYLAQREDPSPLVYGHHMHAFLGHPLMGECGVLIGDETPLGSVIREWNIRPPHIGQDMDYQEPMAELLHEARRMVDAGLTLHGPDLIKALGGAESVLESVGSLKMTLADAVQTPFLRAGHGEDASNAPVNFLPTFAGLLAREAQAAQAGQEYPVRIWLDGRGLTMLLRREPNERLPEHVIWFDATGTPDLYEAILRRPIRTMAVEPQLAGRIYQVTDRANGKSSLLQRGEDGPQTTNKATQLQAQIDAIIEREEAQNPAVITFMGLLDELDQDAAHFYGSRGSNRFEDVDLLIVAGTPLPPLYQIEKLAKALWPERMRAFDTRWYAVDRRYNYVDPDDGQGWQYPVSIFADTELNTLLWQFREAEIVQAAHRARILFRDVPVYLLTNVPIAQLPPDRLMSIADVMGAPAGVDVFGWKRIVEQLRAHVAEHGPVTTRQIQEIAQVSKPTALKYRDILTEKCGWGLAPARERGQGKRGPIPRRYAPGNW